MKIIYIPNVFDKKDRKEFDVEYQPQNVEEYYKDILGEKPDKDAIYPIITGKKVEWDAIPSKYDEIIFINDVQNASQIVTFVVGAILTVIGYFTGGYLSGVGIGMMAGALAGAIAEMFAPEVESPTVATAKNSFSNSKTYAWDGIQNIIGEGSVMPVVYGRHRVGGVVIEGFTDGDVTNGIITSKYLNILLGLSEGEISGVDTSLIYINKQKISDFATNIAYECKTGTVNQTAISWFSKLIKRYNVTGCQLTYLNPYIYATVDEVGSARIGVQCPSLYQVDTAGDIQQLGVYIKVEYAVHDIGTYTTLGTYLIMASSKSTVDFQIHCNFPSIDKYLVRITRTTVEYGSARQAGDTYFTEFHEIQDVSLTYPNIALLGLRILATDKISGAMPALTATIDGVKVLDVNNLSNPKAYSNNPANILYDILTNERYGLGRKISADQIDIDSFIDFYDWCDEEVTYTYYDGSLGVDIEAQEKRFEFNFVLDSSFKAIDIIQKICMTCRAAPYWEGDKIKVVIDKAGSSVQMFSMANIVEDSYEETYIGMEDVANMFEAQILDEENEFNRVTITAIDSTRADEIPNSKTIQLYGLTKKSRAKRELAFAMRKAIGTKKVVDFEAGMDAVICQCGDIVLFQHNTPQYGWGGRIQDIVEVVENAQWAIYFDIDIPVETGETYRLRVRKNDNTQVYYDWISAVTDDIDHIIIFGAEDPAFAVGDLYQFGLVGIESKPFRVTSISKKAERTVKIRGEEYNAAIYTDCDNVYVPQTNYSQLGIVEEWEIDGGVETPIPVKIATNPTVTSSKDDVPPLVAGLVLTEKAEYINETIISCVKVDFPYVTMPANTLAKVEKYEILMSEDGENWASAGWTRFNSFTVTPLTVGKTYYFLVKPYTQWNVTNEIEKTTHKLDYPITVTGEIPTPADVEDFMGVQLGDYIQLMWTPVENTCVKEYEIRMDDWTFGFRCGSTKQTKILIPSTRSGNVTYYIKAISATGEYSPNAIDTTVNYIGSNKNIIFELDNADNDWSGVKHNFTINGTELVMDAGVSEAYFIPDTFIDVEGVTRSRNIVLCSFDSIMGSTLVWDNIESTWGEMESSWGEIQDADSIHYWQEISTFNSLGSTYVDAIRLCGDDATEKGVEPTTSTSPTYGQGTLHKGLVNASGTSVIYDLTIPSTYAMLFGLTLPALSECVPNGSFTTNVDGWSPSSGCSVACVEGGVSGNCLELTDSVGAQCWTNRLVGTGSTGRLITGQRYRLSCYVKAGTSGVDKEFMIGLDNAGVGQVRVIVGATTSSWVKHSLDFTSDGTENYIALVKNHSATGTILFDEASLTMLPNGNVLQLRNATNSMFVRRDHGNFQLADEFVANGSFTANTDGWAATDCELASVSGGVSGNCLQLNRTGGTVQYARQQITGLVIGQTYKFSVWVKAGTAGGVAMKVGFHNGSAYLAYRSGVATGQWVLHTGAFIADTTSGYLYLRKECSDAGTMLFDGVSFCSVHDVNYRLLPQLFTNGSFETDPNTEWSTTYCTIASVSDGQSGNCLAITRTSGDYQTAYQTATTEVGKKYEISVWVKSGTSGDGNFAIVVNSSGSLLLYNGATTSAWVKHTGYFIADATTVTIHLEKNNAAEGTMLFDEAVCRKVIAEVPNLAPNGSFAENITGWAGSNADVSWVSSGGLNGGYLSLSAFTSTSQYAFIDTTLEVGKVYRASMWVKSGTAGNEQCLMTVADRTIGSWMGNAYGTTSSNWAKISFVFTAVEANARIRIGKVSSTIGTMLFDEVFIEELPSGLEVNVSHGANDDMRFGISKDGNGYTFNVGNFTTGEYAEVSDNLLDFTYPTQICLSPQDNIGGIISDIGIKNVILDLGLSDNLLLNSQLENSLTEWTAAPYTTGWAIVSGGLNGSNCLRLTTPDTNYVYQVIPTVVGAQYRFSAWVKSGTAGAVYMSIQAYDVSTNTQIGIFRTTTTNEWQYLSGVFTATGTTTKLLLDKNESYNGTMFFDCAVCLPSDDEFTDIDYPVGFADWKVFADGEYYYDKALFKFCMTNTDPAGLAETTIREFTAVCDVYDISETGTTTITNGGDTSIVFAKVFHEIPIVTVTSFNTTAFAIPEVVSVTKVGFVVRLKTDSGTANGTVSWLAHGY